MVSGAHTINAPYKYTIKMQPNCKNERNSRNMEQNNVLLY